MDLVSLSQELRLLSTGFIRVVLLISLLVFFWARYYISRGYSLSLFFMLLLGFVFSILLLVVRYRYLAVFLGWEGLGVTSFLLIVIYHNWIRTKGGLLTLLTNRLGDAILLRRIGYWLLSRTVLFKDWGALRLLLFVLVAITKSAQWPFISWLPAAIAAPTPVRALVHSSTLVTAGVWLLVRFTPFILLRSFMLFSVGLATLLGARAAALVEIDAKKVVALSTLSQLGLMVFSLSLGRTLICYFHVIRHALSKANLFLVVGGILHSRFSQQDFRFISSGAIRIFVVLSSTIRVLRLSGGVFLSVFYSKEAVLITHYCLFNSTISLIIVITVVVITVSYCLKLIIILVRLFGSIIEEISIRWNFYFARGTLCLTSIIFGQMWARNRFPIRNFSARSTGMYYLLVVGGASILILFSSKILYYWFLIQGNAITLLVILTGSLKGGRPLIERLLEPIILRGLIIRTLLTQLFRTPVLLIIILITTLCII